MNTVTLFDKSDAQNSVTVTMEEFQAIRKLAINPHTKIPAIKALRACNTVFSHETGTWEATIGLCLAKNIVENQANWVQKYQFSTTESDLVTRFKAVIYGVPREVSDKRLRELFDIAMDKVINGDF